MAEHAHSTPGATASPPDFSILPAPYEIARLVEQSELTIERIQVALSKIGNGEAASPAVNEIALKRAAALGYDRFDALRALLPVLPARDLRDAVAQIREAWQLSCSLHEMKPDVERAEQSSKKIRRLLASALSICIEAAGIDLVEIGPVTDLASGSAGA